MTRLLFVSSTNQIWLQLLARPVAASPPAGSSKAARAAATPVRLVAAPAVMVAAPHDASSSKNDAWFQHALQWSGSSETWRARWLLVALARDAGEPLASIPLTGGRLTSVLDALGVPMPGGARLGMNYAMASGQMEEGAAWP